MVLLQEFYPYLTTVLHDKCLLLFLMGVKLIQEIFLEMEGIFLGCLVHHLENLDPIEALQEEVGVEEEIIHLMEEVVEEASEKDHQVILKKGETCTNNNAIKEILIKILFDNNPSLIIKQVTGTKMVVRRVEEQCEEAEDVEAFETVQPTLIRSETGLYTTLL